LAFFFLGVCLNTLVIPGRAKREPGIHQAASCVDEWIPGLRQEAHPGMTLEKFSASS
jgi:hypothetical protein